MLKLKNRPIDGRQTILLLDLTLFLARLWRCNGPAPQKSTNVHSTAEAIRSMCSKMKTEAGYSFISRRSIQWRVDAVKPVNSPWDVMACVCQKIFCY
jgi:hypothetical protein